MVDTLLFKEISSLSTLKPTPKTNEVFSNLVTFCLNAQPEDITLSTDDIARLQNLSAKAESEMEAHWAERIILSKDPNMELLSFWYYKNYTELVGVEYSHFYKLKESCKNVLFAGGGPLPLTSIILARQYGMTCTVLENNKECYELSTKLVTSLGLEKNVTVLYEDAASYSKYEAFDLVYVAALVGLDTISKSNIILSVYNKMKKGSLLLCRSSYGARTLLYPPVPSVTLTLLPPMIEVRPNSPIINSFIILQKT